MPLINQDWYNLNSGRAYPIDDSATSADDAGSRLPPDILADLSLRWPEDLGAYAFVSSVTVTPRLVTVTLQVSNDLNTPGFAPLAVVSVRRPVAVGRVYALQGQSTGVYGWLTFGAGANDRQYVGRFSSAAQALITARAGRAYRPLPVTSLGAVHASTGLTGVVRLQALAPLTLHVESRELDGVHRNCIVFRLIDNTGVEGFPTQISPAVPNVFRTFAGPCAGHPESGTCQDPQPIQFINEVGPDCNGLLTIQFEGCATAAQILDRCGAAIDCGLGLLETCLEHMPSSDGTLPHDRPPIVIPPLDPDTPPEESASSDHFIDVGSLPFFACFEGGSAEDFEVQLGLWGWHQQDYNPDAPCPGQSDDFSDSYSDFSDSGYGVKYYGTLTLASRNITLWKGFDLQTTYRTVSARLKMVSDQVAEQPSQPPHNGGIVLNYKPHDTLIGLFVYHLAEIDLEAQEFRISYFNGTTFQPLVPVSVPGLRPDAWYEISVTVTPSGTPGQTNITASLRGIVDEYISAELSVDVNGYSPADGYFGLCSNRAIARFSQMRVQEALHA